ncbi:MAG: tetratricopeptide repeat protein, partial [Bacteroidota bacterium]
NESFTAEVQGLIGETYLNTRNYAKAIAYFESVPRTNSRAQKAYQIVCYFYGIELFERTNYDQAEAYFAKAMSNAFDADLGLSAQYWQSEAQFRQDNHSAAAQTFKDYLNSRGASSNEYFLRGYYGLAWARFKMKQYQQAFTNFDTYINRADNSEPPTLRADAYLRAGDCQFLLKNYSKANQYYARVVRFNAYGDYAAYQMAEGEYRTDSYNKSVETFDKMIAAFPNSEFRDDALDRISEIYLEWLQNYSQTLKYGRMLVNEYPRSSLVPQTLNRMARAAYELGRQDEAVSYFKKVVTQYGNNRQQAQLALDNLSNLLSEREFDRLLKDYRNQNPAMDEGLAGVVFETGKQRFFSGSYTSAIDQFSTYISDYRSGPDYFEALVFRARSYRELGQLPKALNDYGRVYGANANTPFASVALQEAGEIEFEQGNYTASLSLYQQLETLASKLQNRVVAWFGIAKNEKALGRYAQAQDVLLQIAESPEVEVYSRTEALVEIGRCQYLRGTLDEAFQTFTVVENDFKNAFGAESQAMKAQILLDQGILLKERGQAQAATDKFNAVKEATRYMANNYPTFNYWRARTFLVVAEAYYQLGNAFQAKGTLESLAREDRFPDIQQEALDRLAELEAEGN